MALRWIALVGMAAQLGSAVAGHGYMSTDDNLKPLEGRAGTADLFPMPECFGFRLEEATIDEMQDAMTSGALTSMQLVQCYIMRTFQTEEYIKSVLSPRFRSSLRSLVTVWCIQD